MPSKKITSRPSASRLSMKGCNSLGADLLMNCQTALLSTSPETRSSPSRMNIQTLGNSRLLQSDGFPDARVPQENEGLVSAHEAFADIPDKLALLVDRRDLGTLRVATLRDPDDLLDELLNGSQKPGALCLEPAGDLRQVLHSRLDVGLRTDIIGDPRVKSAQIIPENVPFRRQRQIQEPDSGRQPGMELREI